MGKTFSYNIPTFTAEETRDYIDSHILGIRATDSLTLELPKHSFLTSALSDFPTPDIFGGKTLSVLGFLIKILKEIFFISF